MRRSDVRSAAVQPVLHDHDGRFFERPGSLRRDHDLGATLGEAQRAFAADTTRRADDDYDLVLDGLNCMLRVLCC